MPERLPDIAELLPQQPPMRLLDRLVAWSSRGVDAEVHVHPGVPFHRATETGSGVPAWVGLEYLAQAAAAWSGLAARAHHAAPRAGMLVACRRYDCAVPVFVDGGVLSVRVWPSSTAAGSLVKFSGEIRLHDDVLATGELSVYLPTEDA